VSALHPWRGIRPFERHSIVLLFAGMVYILIGVSYILADPTPSRVNALYYALAGPMTFDSWGCVFILTGLLAVVSSRWPPISETWGYQALTGLSSGWAAFYAAGVIFHGSPVNNISGFLSWGLIGFMWWAVSGLVNPTHLYKMVFQIQALQEENLKLHEEILRCLEEKG
jgi:hypothetical protein